MAALEANQIYVGGAAAGVCCALCSATTTSGSWRKGWPVSPGSKNWANLCNRCGQRWAKVGRPVLQPGQELCSRRPEVKEKDITHWAGSHDKLRGDSGYSPTHSDSESCRGNNFYISAHAGGFPSALQVGPTSPVHKSYCLQKLSYHRTQYMLVWVQNADLESTLAVVGIDSRSSGHYTYTKVPEFPGPELTCTNRAKVISWLGQIGIVTQVPESACLLPAMTPASLIALTEGSRLDSEGWVDIREEVLHMGTYWVRRFYLVDAYGTQVLAASSAGNGSNVFRAELAFGGTLFPSLDSLMSWLHSHLSPVRQHSPGGAACAPSLPGATPLPCYPGLLPPLIPDAPLGLTPCGGKVRPQLPPGLAPLGMELEDFGLTLASPVTLIQAPAVGLGASCLDDPALHAWPGVPSPLSLVLPGSPGPAPQPAQATPRFHGQAGAPRDAGDDQPLTPHQLSHWAHVLRTPDPATGVPASATALPILSALSSRRADLAAVDRLALPQAVAALRGHPHPEVACMAGQVAERWRQSALSVLGGMGKEHGLEAQPCMT